MQFSDYLADDWFGKFPISFIVSDDRYAYYYLHSFISNSEQAIHIYHKVITIDNCIKALQIQFTKMFVIAELRV